MPSLRVCFAPLLLLSAALVLRAADAPPPLEWSAADTTGGTVKVPAERPSVLLFVMADQAQSKQAIDQVQALFKPGATPAPAQVVAILSGKDAASHAQALAAQAKWAGPIVLDPDYAASGKVSVHVWPTTVIVTAKGETVAHIAGLPRTYAKDLDAYVQFALGKLDKAELVQRLAAHAVVADSPEQMAARHLQVAQRLADKGLVDQARVELAEAVKHPIAGLALQVELAQVHLAVGQPAEALAVLDKIDPNAAGAPQRNILRGRALVALGQWDQARAVLEAAVRLNPEPAEGCYQLGLVYQHQGDWPNAAKAFRQAFEATPLGRKTTTAPAP